MTIKLRFAIFFVIFGFLAVAFAVNSFYVGGVVKKDAVSSWMLYNERNKIRIEEYLRQIKNISLAFASNGIYKDFLSNQTTKIENDIKNIFLDALSSDSLIQAMRIVKSNGDILIYVKDGKAIENKGSYINISSKEYFRLLGDVESREPLFSNIERALTPGDTEFGPPLVRVLVPIYDADAKLGYLLINFDTSALNDFLYAGVNDEPHSFIAGYAPEYSGIFLFHQQHMEYEFANQIGSEYFVSTVYSDKLNDTLKNNTSGIVDMPDGGFAVFDTIFPRNYKDTEWKIVYIIPEIRHTFNAIEFLNDKFIISVLAFTIILWLIIPYAISRSTITPVNRLREGIEKIGAGEFSFRFDVAKFPPELKPVAATVNSMAASIGGYLDKIELLTKMQTMGLIAGGMAHELNSPLNSIILACDLLKRSATEKQKEDLTLIIGETQRCIGIISSLRAMAPKNRANMVFVKTNLKNIVTSSTDKTDGVSLECSDAFMMGDCILLETAVKNLYKNALEATGANRRIVFKTYAKDGEAILEVEDNGCGIDAAKLEHFPAPFSSTKKTGTNMGIGVCLVYNIATEHGGTVSIESEIGKGTKFTLRFKSYA